MRAAGCAAGGGPLSAAVAAASEEMVAKDLGCTYPLVR
jgi:hypothetical protein